jgi:2,4-dienoyl-CoA reductase-like NADH-dependent reductase (Old Yellow Enzyme family)
LTAADALGYCLGSKRSFAEFPKPARSRDAMTSALFTPLKLRELQLANRIAVSPMCQYSAEDGVADDWHLAHLTMLAGSGAGLVVIEMTDVMRTGRITPGCLGLYSDECEAGLKRVIASVRRWGQAKLGIQLAHAGRKGSTNPPWKNAGGPLKADEGAWQTVAPSPIPFAEGWPAPKELTTPEIEQIIVAFADAARRAARLGFDTLEIHGSHGYLLHQFLSPLSNKRNDEWGGSFANRMRFPLRVAEAMRAVWPKQKPLGMRITTNEWTEGGLTPDDAVAFARELKARGLDYACCSGGGNIATAKVPVGPGYMVDNAAKVKREAGIATRAIGMILAPQQAEDIVSSGKADFVALARGFLDDPHWAWHAAETLGAKVSVPPQYARATVETWPGAKIVRPPKPAAAAGDAR